MSSRVLSRAETHVDRVAPLVLVAVTVEDDVNTVVVQQVLHGQPHALILLVVVDDCMNMHIGIDLVMAMQAASCTHCSYSV